MQREIRPAITPEEDHEAGQVYDHAMRRHVKLIARHPVKVRIRCNQMASDMHSICLFDKWIETTAVRAEADASRVLREHFIAAHPSLTSEDRETLIGRRVSTLRDLPIIAPRRALS